MNYVHMNYVRMDYGTAWWFHELSGWVAHLGWPASPDSPVVAKVWLSSYGLCVSQVPGKGPRLLSLWNYRLFGS